MIELETDLFEKFCKEKWCMEDGATTVETAA